VEPVAARHLVAVDRRGVAVDVDEGDLGWLESAPTIAVSDTSQRICCPASTRRVMRSLVISVWP